MVWVACTVGPTLVRAIVLCLCWVISVRIWLAAVGPVRGRVGPLLQRIETTQEG